MKPLSIETLRTELFNRTGANGVGMSGAEVDAHIAMLTQSPADDAGNADVVAALYSSQFLWCEHLGWLRWDTHHYEREGAANALDGIVEQTLRYRCIAAASQGHVNTSIISAAKPTHRHVKDCVERLKTRYYAEVSEFDADPDSINVANGVLNLRTGQLTAHCPTQRFTYCLATPYDPQADTREVIAFLLQVVEGGEAVIESLMTFLGYTLTGRTDLEKLAYIVGAARAGKGTLTEAVKQLMGKLAEGRDFSTFTAKRDGDSQNFDLAGLRQCRVVFADESSKRTELSAAKIKTMTGGSHISCAFKGRDMFSFRPQFKIVLTSNFEPNIDPDDDAAWGRLVSFQFPHSHDEGADSTVKQRMKSPENQRALLALMVQGAKRFYALNGKQIPMPQCLKDLKAAQRERLDTVAMWLTENCEAGEFAPNETIYANYKAWCESNGVMPKMQRGLTDALKTKGYAVSEKCRIGGKEQRGVMGLRVH